MSLSSSPWLKHTYAYIHTNTLAGSSVEDEVARRWCHGLITLPVLSLLFLQGRGWQINEEWKEWEKRHWVNVCVCMCVCVFKCLVRTRGTWVIGRNGLFAASILNHSGLMTCLNSYWYHAISAICSLELHTGGWTSHVVCNHLQRALLNINVGGTPSLWGHLSGSVDSLSMK